MTCFIVFKVKSATDNKKLVDALGSDGTIPVDGRFSLYNLVLKAKTHMEQLKDIRTFAGFEIHKGARFDKSARVYKEYYYE